VIDLETGLAVLSFPKFLRNDSNVGYYFEYSNNHY